MDVGIGSLRSAALDGYYWTLTSYPSEFYSYLLHFNNANIIPSYDGLYRWLGFTVHRSGYFFLHLYYKIITTLNLPIYLTRGGYVQLNTGSLRNAVGAGLNWSMTAYDSASHAYYLYASSNAYASDSDNRFYGLTVRFFLLL